MLKNIEFNFNFKNPGETFWIFLLKLIKKISKL